MQITQPDYNTCRYNVHIEFDLKDCFKTIFKVDLLVNRVVLQRLAIQVDLLFPDKEEIKIIKWKNDHGTYMYKATVIKDAWEILRSFNRL